MRMKKRILFQEEAKTDEKRILCNFIFSKYSNVSFLLFPPSYPLNLFFLLQSFLLPSSFSYGFFEVRFGHGVGMNLTFFCKKLE